jgi:ABC-type antimicrobial peptide transport system permease subunit
VRKTDRWLTFLQVLQWIGLIQGVVFGLVAIGSFLNTAVFVARSSTTTGTVISFEQHQDDVSGQTFSPIFTYVAPDGSAQTGHSNSSSNPPGFEIGEKVPVRYETRNPSNARIATYWQTWALATAFAIASAVTWLVGLFFRWKVIRRKTRKPKLQQIQSQDQI